MRVLERQAPASEHHFSPFRPKLEGLAHLGRTPFLRLHTWWRLNPGQRYFFNDRRQIVAEELLFVRRVPTR